MSTSSDSNDREEGLKFQPKFDAAGLVTCVATDAASGEVLMVAHMNAEALRKTIDSGDAWYFSRSRNALWRKGETSGHTQRVVEMRMDCDQDAVWIRVEQTGAACHTGRRSCFYRAVKGGEGGAALSFVDATERGARSGPERTRMRASTRKGWSRAPCVQSTVVDLEIDLRHEGPSRAHPGMTRMRFNPPLTIIAAG